MAFLTTDLSRFVVDPPSVAEVAPPATLNGPTAVVVANSGERTVGTSRFSSASQLSVTWRAPTGYAVDHYEITASESVFGTSSTTSVSAADASRTITGLKSGTTSEEYWQLQGTSGATADAVSRVTADSNTLNYALSYGDWAPASLRGKIRYYYNPTTAAEKGTKTASSLTTFDVLSGYGLVYGTGNDQASGIGSTIG